MGRVFLVQIEGKSYRCKCCSSPLAVADDILSRTFSCGHGTAYLFNNAVNVTVGPGEERVMLSGTHTVADIYCCNCGQILGWKYMKAQDKSQKYKEGKFVLERWRISEGDGSNSNNNNNNNLDLESYPNNISSDEDAH
ncbi:protein yippee-like At5g53940 isoform X2 [Impatiens glandulifera]|uniref:protein yippee-like At5g53940 isoform X2 n=1 Tax=Impatiens glandulifera TaxID=253017 RepID=UPI001FB15741|nr:protein yippee-like At5g53940 isoform X2 [Impatiens glandulifera]